jgi:ketosteroid isomerase-like protein
MSDLEAQRLALLTRMFAAFNRHDAAGVMACMTEDVVFDTAAGPEMFGRRIAGTADVRAAFERVWTDMPDVSWTCSHHHVFGERGLSEWTFRATTSDGKRIEAEGCDLFTFAGEKVAHKSAFRKDRPLLPAVTALTGEATTP